MTKLQTNKKQFAVTIGIMVALLIVMAVNLNITKVEASYQVTPDSISNTAKPLQANQHIISDSKGNQALSTTRVADYKFKLNIQKINLQKDITENVDPADESIYGPVILQNIAHGKYTL